METPVGIFFEEFVDQKPHPTTRFADFDVSGLRDGPVPDPGAIIRRFNDEEYQQILVRINILDTDFDFPEVVNLMMARYLKSHWHQEFLTLLRLIDREVPPDLNVHLIAGNYATHKHAWVKAWLAARPRHHVHFTPT